MVIGRRIYDSFHHGCLGNHAGWLDNVVDGPWLFAFTICWTIGTCWFGHGPAIPLSQEVFDPLMSIQEGLLILPLVHLLANGCVVLISHLYNIHRVCTCSSCLPEASNDYEDAQRAGKKLVGHIHRLLLLFLLSIPFLVPFFPVFPRGVHTGIPRFLSPRPVGAPVKVFHTPYSSPSCAV